MLLGYRTWWIRFVFDSSDIQIVYPMSGCVVKRLAIDIDLARKTAMSQGFGLFFAEVIASVLSGNEVGPGLAI